MLSRSSAQTFRPLTRSVPRRPPAFFLLPDPRFGSTLVKAVYEGQPIAAGALFFPCQTCTPRRPPSFPCERLPRCPPWTPVTEDTAQFGCAADFFPSPRTCLATPRLSPSCLLSFNAFQVFYRVRFFFFPRLWAGRGRFDTPAPFPYFIISWHVGGRGNSPLLFRGSNSPSCLSMEASALFLRRDALQSFQRELGPFLVRVSFSLEFPMPFLPFSFFIYKLDPFFPFESLWRIGIFHRHDLSVPILPRVLPLRSTASSLRFF